MLPLRGNAEPVDPCWHRRCQFATVISDRGCPLRLGNGRPLVAKRDGRIAGEILPSLAMSVVSRRFRADCGMRSEQSAISLSLRFAGPTHRARFRGNRAQCTVQIARAESTSHFRMTDIAACRGVRSAGRLTRPIDTFAAENEVSLRCPHQFRSQIESGRRLPIRF